MEDLVVHDVWLIGRGGFGVLFVVGLRVLVLRRWVGIWEEWRGCGARWSGGADEGLDELIGGTSCEYSLAWVD